MAPRRPRRRRDARRCWASSPSPASPPPSWTRSPRSLIRSRGRRPDLQGLPRLSGLDLHVAELDGRARYPGPVHARGGRPDLGRRRRHPRRLRGRLRLHVRRRGDRRRCRSGCSTSARPRSPPGSSEARAGQPHRGHLRRRPADDRGRRLLGRPLARRPRRRALDARGAPGSELRRARPRADARSPA